MTLSRLPGFGDKESFSVGRLYENVEGFTGCSVNIDCDTVPDEYILHQLLSGNFVLKWLWMHSGGL